MQCCGGSKAALLVRLVFQRAGMSLSLSVPKLWYWRPVRSCRTCVFSFFRLFISRRIKSSTRRSPRTCGWMDLSGSLWLSVAKNKKKVKSGIFQMISFVCPDFFSHVQGIGTCHWILDKSGLYLPPGPCPSEGRAVIDPFSNAVYTVQYTSWFLVVTQSFFFLFFLFFFFTP